MAKTHTYVFHANYSGTGSALINRLTNTANIFDKTMQAVVVYDDCFPSLGNNDFEDIIAFWNASGTNKTKI